MQGEFKGLKALILKENPSAFYIHYFAHQLQLDLVGLAKKNDDVASLFLTVNGIINVVGSSAIRCDVLLEKHKGLVLEAVDDDVIESGRDLNQETSLQRAGDTRWGSHYCSLISVFTMFSVVTEVLEYLSNESNNSTMRIEAGNWYRTMLTFEFVLSLHLMISLLGITDDLSKALQRKDQDIINSMSLVKVCKKRLHDIRDDGWDALFEKVSTFYTHYSIGIPSMESPFVPIKGKQKINDHSNLEHYKFEIVNAVIDTQLDDLNDRFNESTTELLLCVACLSSKDSFAAFDVTKLIKLAEFYPMDFSVPERVLLELENYIAHVHLDDLFGGVEKIGELTRIMVDTGKDRVFPLVYRLLTLTFTLPIATASVERLFSLYEVCEDFPTQQNRR